MINDNFDSHFNTARNGIAGMGCAIVICNIIVGIAIIVGIVAGCNYVKSKGLKNIANSVWEGEGTNTVETTN